MRRFWLLLLLMVLPVQMSWAAMHHCDDTPAAGASVLVVASQGGDSVAADPSDDQRRSADELGKTTPSAHACDGLHEIMAFPAAVFLAPAPEAVLPNSRPVFRPRVIASRLDRPRWSAA